MRRGSPGHRDRPDGRPPGQAPTAQEGSNAPVPGFPIARHPPGRHKQERIGQRRSGPLVERIAGWSSRHRKTAISGWLLLLVAVMFVAGQAPGTRSAPSYSAALSAGRTWLKTALGQ